MTAASLQGPQSKARVAALPGHRVCVYSWTVLAAARDGPAVEG
jgi:hypothetical protein